MGTNKNLTQMKRYINKIIIKRTSVINKQQTIKKIKGKKYINLSTGEILPIKSIISFRGENENSLRQTLNKLKDLIMASTTNYKNVLLVCLTYAEKNFDLLKLRNDFQRFIRRLRKKIVEFGKIEYIYVVEKVENQYHIHCVLSFLNNKKEKVFIDNRQVEKLWGKGFTDTKQPRKFDNVYSYLLPHLSKVVTSENEHYHNKAIELRNLPTQCNYYRYSKGIKKPTTEYIEYEKAQEIIRRENFTLTNKRTYRKELRRNSNFKSFTQTEEYHR